MAIVISRTPLKEFSLSIAVTADHQRKSLEHEISALFTTTEFSDLQEGEEIQLWIEDAQATDAELIESTGFVPYRDLLQLRCLLPAGPSTITTRSFRVGVDDEAFLSVNRRAFAWHPEQGDLDNKGFAKLQEEAWFNPNGFLLYEVDSQLAGFCWTKIHLDHSPALGEIYAIAINPDFHGKGLGRPMTLAGLDYLSSKGINTGMLYVEADNAPALHIYKKIGFSHFLTNRAFRYRV